MQHLGPMFNMWEDVLAQLRRRSVCWQGNPLSRRDVDTFTEAIVMCGLHLTDMSTRHGGIGTDREIVAWAHLCASLDVSELGSFLSDVITFLRGYEGGMTLKQFKRCFSTAYPFTGRFVGPIRGALESFLSAPTASGFYPCYQFFSFLTHLTLLDIAVDLEDEYEELEQRLQSQKYPSSILHGMNEIMKEWFSDFSISEENLNPHHGPGAVAELKRQSTLEDKYRCLGTDALLSYVFSHHAGVDVTSYYAYPCANWERASKLVFVPKSMKTRRSISKEPATLQFWQQAVGSATVDYIHKHPFLSRHIDLRDQKKNADLAISASASQAFATIDLSSASDTVTNTMVKAVFAGTPLYPYLVALRSRTVELPSGKVLRVEKYAPMGSALCFPVETLIFSCAVEYAVRRASATHLGSFPVWRVYGDDIIVQTPLFEDVVLVLEALGFILNRSKSFSSPKRFRESCGGEGYDGVDVTPLRISRRFYSVRGRLTSRHAEIYMGLVDMANHCHAYEFSLLRAWIIRVLLEYPSAPPLFSEEGRGSLISPEPDNYRARRRVNTRLQRGEIRVVESRPVPYERGTAPDADHARYVETLRLSRFREGDVFYPDDIINVPFGSGHAKLRTVWIDRSAHNFACLGLINSLQTE